MEMTRIETWAYGGLFVVALPLALWGWARGAEAGVGLPAVHSLSWGVGLAVAGALLWAWGALSLWVKGGGLPMNAFPPPRLVTSGPYAFTGHPLYAGATLACFGVSVAAGSAAGLWLVTPSLALGAAALWWGYERSDLEARLGRRTSAPWLGVPFATPEPPTPAERVGAAVSSLWAAGLVELALHAACLTEPQRWAATAPDRAVLALGLIFFAVATASSRAVLRDLVLTSWLGAFFVGLSCVVLPGGPIGGRLPVAADGAFAGLSVMAGAAVLLRRLPLRETARWAAAAGVGALVVGRAGEAALGALAFVSASARWHWWGGLLRACEWVANSWREWERGGVRLIGIGWLAALPAAGSAAYVVLLLGPSVAWTTVGVYSAIVAGAGLWGQLVEGSPRLSRPYGFFGGVAAVLLFALASALVPGGSPWFVLGGFAATAPWAQGLGRLRCFANGCCHGAPCQPALGVVYRNPHTRVVKLAGLGGVPIHPTQLYSLAANTVIGLLMMRLWAEGVSLALLAGVYFVAMGLGRFAEEAWRGEPQTLLVGGLRLYQWLAVGSVAFGAWLTTVTSAPSAPRPVPSLAALWAALAVGGLTWLVTSVDFPKSTRRFARLA
jgi:protein-S-isoprenylcysteine O-methyltransferase Ste14